MRKINGRYIKGAGIAGSWSKEILNDRTLLSPAEWVYKYHKTAGNYLTLCLLCDFQLIHEDDLISFCTWCINRVINMGRYGAELNSDVIRLVKRKSRGCKIDQEADILKEKRREFDRDRGGYIDDDSANRCVYDACTLLLSSKIGHLDIAILCQQAKAVNAASVVGCIGWDEVAFSETLKSECYDQLRELLKYIL